jgi:SAM-dependent methyltransferase
MVERYKNFYYCKNCYIFQNRPQPNKLIWKLIHKDLLLTAYRNPERLEGLKENHRRRLEVIEEFKSEGRIFDIGANGGVFLDEARKNGWDIMGNELSNAAIAWARNNLNIRLYNTYFSKIPERQNSFDAIVMCNVLEHMHDPLLSLKKAYFLLKPEGIIAIFVPIKNFAQIKKKYESLHLFEFEIKGLKKLLESIAIQIIYEVEEKNERFNFLTIICKKNKGS